MSSTSVVIASWNTRELLRECLQSLLASSPPPDEIVVVDNASSDRSAELVRNEFPSVHLIHNEKNLGYTRACNQGIQSSRGDCVLLLNADTRLAPDAVAKLVDFLDRHPDYAAAAPQIFNPDGSLQETIMRFPNWKTPFFFATPIERWFPDSRELRRYFARDFDYERDADVEQPAAACLLVRRATLESLGFFDERLWLFFSDVDLCSRIHRTGAKIRYVASAHVVHHLGQSTKQYADFVSRWHRDRLIYQRAHHGRIAADWVKLCVLFAWIDFVLRQYFAALVGRPHEPVGPITRSFIAFLER